MGYAPVSKVLSTYTPMEELALAQSQAQPITHHGQPQLRLHRRHRRHHHVRHEQLEVLDMLLVAQNRVTPHKVSPKTIAEYKINKK